MEPITARDLKYQGIEFKHKSRGTAPQSKRARSLYLADVAQLPTVSSDPEWVRKSSVVSLQKCAPSSRVPSAVSQPPYRWRPEPLSSVAFADMKTYPMSPGGFAMFRRVESIQDRYELTCAIHSSKNTRVFIGCKTASGNKHMSPFCAKGTDEVIIKSRFKKDYAKDRSFREVMAKLCSMPPCRYICGITEVLEDDLDYHIIMPKCAGSDLFDFLVTADEIAERECKRIIREIVTAIGHLHKHGLVHGDVKPENIMFSFGTRSQTHRTVKLVDLDTCALFENGGETRRHVCGTPAYMSPEAWKGHVTPSKDIWSIGVILYFLMTGDMPWDDEEEGAVQDRQARDDFARRMYEKLRSEEPDWGASSWDQFPEARDLCKHLLAFNMLNRISTTEDVMQHPWLAQAEVIGGF
eukprot:TRINITY_DN48954_c0_g1_i1.p1 TRINITY_DN48954_c0_g1~~TRINITY_DN48954_c0_g1_i1.p1  ORF type:complete len:424 (-),score=47.56 TRINITY_DN48954_c0_g1_i1:132-1358(-)